MVIKKDNSRQTFDPTKLLNRLLIACAKRPVSISVLEEIVADIESSFYREHMREITSTEIGDKVMEKLKEVDEVAYVRFASVYKDFTDVDTFTKEIKKIKKER